MQFTIWRLFSKEEKDNVSQKEMLQMKLNDVSRILSVLSLFNQIPLVEKIRLYVSSYIFTQKMWRKWNHLD